MINLSNVSLQFGGRYLFKNVNYRINAGNKISLVGVNGAGKSSFLKLLIGELLPESGKIIRQKGINIGYLPQDNIIHIGKTLFEEAKSSLNTIINLEQKEFEITNKLSQNNIHEEEQNDLINQLGEIHHRLEELDSYSTESKIEKILTGLGFEKNNFFRLTDEFSGGWQMRIALSKILISQNDLLLLDEPTNHLDIDSLKWLLDFLKDYKGALLVVSHDKHFVNQVTNKTLEIYNGGFNTFNGDYDAYLKFKKERDIQTANLYEQQQNKINETKRFIEKYRYKATKAKQAQSRIKKLEKINLIELPDNKTKINIKFPESPQSGKVNIELISISKSFGEKVVFDNISFRV
ncbi:MAG TPA: ABC-F family ATP-binding cassette domain-containing protein, partial [Ignavibacteria bacterium]|nr:ABC-F family ATP-binding cassette domain-containing protein [Ignavibacteria bacterium]